MEAGIYGKKQSINSTQRWRTLSSDEHASTHIWIWQPCRRHHVVSQNSWTRKADGILVAVVVTPNEFVVIVAHPFYGDPFAIYKKIYLQTGTPPWIGTSCTLLTNNSGKVRAIGQREPL